MAELVLYVKIVAGIWVATAVVWEPCLGIFMGLQETKKKKRKQKKENTQKLVIKNDI